MIEAFLWGMFGAGSLVLGAVIVFFHRPGTRALGLIMGFGAGVLLSAVSFELVEEATGIAGGTGTTFLGFFAGAIVYYLGDAAISRAGYRNRKDISGAPPDASGLSIVLGAVLDGIPESAVLGLTLLQTGNIGLSMLVAVFVSNLPESIAASQSMLSGGWARSRLLAMWTVVAIVSGLAAGLGFALLDTASGGVVAFVLSFAGGAILTMLATTMMPEAYEHAGRATGLATVLGFAVAYGIDWIAG